MLKLLKSLFPILVLTLLLSACGEDPGSSLEENLDSIDLSIDTVQMIVDLPVVGGSQTGWGQKEETYSLPMSIDEMNNIRIIAMDAQGKKHLIGRVTAKESGSRTIYMNQIDSLNQGDVIWISDNQDGDLYIAYVEILSGNRVKITVNFSNNTNAAGNSGSPSVAVIYQNGQPSIRFYFHFERR